MSKKPGSVITAEQHARNAFKRVDAKQAIADREATPEFQENYERLRAERRAREQAAKVRAQESGNKPPLTKLQKFVERGDGGKQGRVAYAFTPELLPESLDMLNWRGVDSFNAAEELLNDTRLKAAFNLAIEQGYAIADPQASHQGE